MKFFFPKCLLASQRFGHRSCHFQTANQSKFQSNQSKMCLCSKALIPIFPIQFFKFKNRKAV